MPEPLNVLVTGATGKQGGHLVAELLARDVIGLRELYSEVNWHRFSTWEREQDRPAP